MAHPRDTRRTSSPEAGRRLHPWAVRTMHWINAFCMLAMIGSGWGIYDDDVVIRGLHFPAWARLGSWAAPSLNIHLAVMWFVAIAAGVSQVVTGLALWKPVQLQWIVAVLGGFQSVRVIHFAGMAILVGFLLVHVALSLLVPQTLLAMLGGGPRLSRTRRTADTPPS